MDIIIEAVIFVIFWPIILCTVRPLVALIPCIVHIALAIHVLTIRPRSVMPYIIGVSVVLWSLYLVWELHVYRTIPIESVPIRIDLLLITPILYATTIGSLIIWIMAIRHKRMTQDAQQSLGGDSGRTAADGGPTGAPQG